MKQKIVMVCVLMILLCIFLWPEKNEIEYLDQTAVPYQTFEIKVICDEIVHQATYVKETTLKEIFERSHMILEKCNYQTLNMHEIVKSSKTINLSKTIEDTPAFSKVNINQASFQTLITVPGITETRAASIIIYREQHGAFLDLDELIHVKHIGVTTLEKIKPYLTIS